MKKKKKEKSLEKPLTLKMEYERMKLERQPYLDKALLAAKYTIPSLLKEENCGREIIQDIVTPNQSVGADGVNNLASKMCVTLLPPNQTFYRFTADPVALREQAKLAGADYREYESSVKKGLALTEKLLLDYQQTKNDRVAFGEMLKHIIIAGNVLGVQGEKEGLYFYPLTRYCVKRDYVGNVLKVITTESIGVTELPDKIREEVIQKLIEKEALKECPDFDFDTKEVTIYTVYRKKETYWETYQEIEDLKIESSYGKFPVDVPPIMALRFTRIDGESYGRGLIEEYIGDISHLDYLELAIKEASVAGAKVIPLVNPTGLTKIKDIVTARNGEPVIGRADDVQFLQVQKYNDLKVASQEADKIEKRLNKIFVMKAAIQRAAERVTAEEIRQMASDLDETLGNQYSIMCKEFQESYVKITFFYLRKTRKNELPDLIRSNDIKLSITTGLEALGRTSDLNKLTTFVQIMAQLAPTVQQLGMKPELVARDVASSLNIDIEGYFYTEEEKAQMAQQAQENAIAQQATPNLISKMGDMVLQQQQQQQGNTNGTN